MSDMREVVARKMDAYDCGMSVDAINTYWDNRPDEQQYGHYQRLLGRADAAIEAATPYIEAALLSRLADKLDQRYPYGSIPADGTVHESVAAWVREQGGQE